MSSEPRFSWARLRWLLPVVLSLLPLLVLVDAARDERRREADAVRRTWNDDHDRLLSRVQAMARPQFWLEWTARQIRARLENETADLSPTGLGRRAAHARASLRLRHVARPQVWVVAFPGGDPRRGAVLCQGPGLASEQRFLVTGLFQQLALQDLRQAHQLDAAVWLQRIRRLFGHATHRELFSPVLQGTAFNCIYNRQMQRAVWTLLRRHGHAVGGLLVVMPVHDQEHTAAQRECLAQWPRFREAHDPMAAWPAFFPMPLPADTPGTFRCDRPVLPRALATPHWRIPLHRWLAAFTLDHQTGDAHFPAVHLPGAALGRTLSFPAGWGRIAALEPLAGHWTGIFGPRPRTRPGRMAALAWIWGFAVAATWTLLALHRYWRGRLPTPGLRVTLSLWLLGVGAIPLFLTVTASHRLAHDLAANLLDHQRREVDRVLRQLESGDTVLTRRFHRACRAITTGTGLTDALGAYERGRRHGASLLAEIWNQCRQARMRPYSVIIVPRRGEPLSRFAPGVNAETRRVLVMVSRDYAIATFIQIERSRSNTGMHARRRDGQYAPTKYVTLRTEDTSMLDTSDQTVVFGIGRRQLVKYHNLVRTGDDSQYAVFIVWDQDSSFAEYLRLAVPRAELAAPHLRLAAWRQHGDRLQPIAPAVRRDDAALLAIARRAGQSGAPTRTTRGDLIEVRPARSLPQYLIGARTSLEPIRMVIQAERQRLALSLSVFVLLIIAVGWGLARRLGSPVRRMTDALHAVAQGRLDIDLSSARRDELGEATRTLATMVQWLREKRKLSSYVAPDVLAAVAGGVLGTAASARQLEIVALVSDIRSFTTLSETHPPDAIFAMLNQHQEQMALAIGEHGGRIDRFVGDAVTAFFVDNEPGDAAPRALAAAAAMVLRHRQLVAHRQHRGLFAYRIGIGIDAGPVVAGVVGDPQVRLDHAILGEPLHHAAELESSSRHGRFSHIVVSSRARALLPTELRFAAIPDSDGHELVDPQQVCFGAKRQPMAATAAVASPAKPPAADGGPGPATATRSAPTGATEPPAMADVGPTPTATRRPPLGSSWATTAGLLLLWLLPAGLLLLGTRSQEQHRQAVRARHIADRLHDDLRRLERSIKAESQARTLLNAVAHDLCDAVADRADPTLDLARRTLGRLAPEFFRPLEAILPNLTWTTSALATDRNLQLREPDQAWLLASGGRPLAFLDRDFAQLTRMLTLATCNWSFDATNFDGLRWLQGVGKRIVGEYYANHRLILLYREGCANVFPVTTEDRPRMIFWRALVPPAWWTDPSRTAPPSGDEYDARTLTLRRIWGGMLVYFDQVRSGGPPARDRWLDLALRCLWRNARRDGIEVAVALDNRWRGRWSSPAWRNAPDLRLLRIRSSHQVVQSDRWAAIETLLVDPPIRLRIARRLSDPPAPNGRRADDATAEPSTGAGIGALWYTIGMGWLAGGALVLLALTLQRGHSQLLPSLTLQRQLLLAFLTVLVPGAAVSTMQLERSFGERAWRLHTDRERSLHQRLDAAENARTLYLGQALATIRALAGRPEYVNTWYATTGAQDRAATPPARLGRLGRQLVDHGVILKDLVIADGDGFRCQAISGASDTARGANDQVRTFGSLHARTVREIAPDGGPARARRDDDNLGEGLKDEELGNFLGSVLLPEHLAEQFMAPRSLSTPGGQLNDKLVYNQMLTLAAHPPLLLSCVLDIEGIMLGYFRDVLTSDDTTTGYRVGVTFANHPAWSMAPPWFKGHWATSEGKWVIDVPTLYAFNPPEIEHPLGWTQVSGEPMTTVTGAASAGRMILTRAAVTPALSGRLLHATRNIGGAQSRLAAHRQRAHLLLALLALVSLFLAMQLAGALLQPVLDLAAAAHRVMAGDFTSRLRSQGTDEFARLGAAFNVMVRGVAEGRMLGRFVSAAVHDAVRDAGREAAARRGEHRTITVMFAGLGGFGDRLQKWPPAPLITALNRVLEAWSRHIRAHGGEIDKFIGEKVLAVFPPERFADAPAAAAAAVAAGRALRAEMDRHRKYLDLPAGVGIVSGPVLAGILGTDQVRREHTVIGDTVNLAARLCELATHQDGGDLLLDGGTVRLLHGDANTTADGQALIGHFARLPVTSVKGKRREIEVFRWCD